MMISLTPVVPGNPPTEADLHKAKTRSHERIPPDRRRKERRGAEQHQAQTHHRDNPRGKRSPSHDGGSVQQQPSSRKGSKGASLKKSVGQQCAHHNRRSKTQQEFAAGPRKEPGIGAVRLSGSGGRGNGYGDEGFGEPDGKPSARSDLSRSDESRDQRGDAHGHAAPARHSGKFRGPGHGFADIAKMVGGASINGDGLAAGRTKRPWGRRHRVSLRYGITFVKYFVLQSACKTQALRSCVGSGQGESSSEF